MEHYITKCSCGAVISQCRCMGEKTVTVVENGCPKCTREIVREYQKEKDKESHKVNKEDQNVPIL